MTSDKFLAQLEQLTRAVARLREVLAEPETDISQDATVQRFEFTFELAWKTAKTYINAERPAKEAKSAADVIRAAADFELIDNPEVWLKEYLEARNATSHTYDQEAARGVYQAAKNFLPEAEKLLARLKGKS